MKVSEMKAKIANAEREMWFYREALAAREMGEAKRIGQSTVDETHIGMWLIHPERAHGGLLMIRHEVKGQPPSYEVHLLDDVVKWHSGRMTEYSIAIHDLAYLATSERDQQLKVA